VLFLLNKGAVVSVKDTLRPRAALGLLAADRIEFDVTVIVWTALDFLAGSSLTSGGAHIRHGTLSNRGIRHSSLTTGSTWLARTRCSTLNRQSTLTTRSTWCATALRPRRALDALAPDVAYAALW